MLSLPPADIASTRELESSALLEGLVKVKQDLALALNDKTRTCIGLIGNEGADMDSCVGAICQALLLRDNVKDSECVFPIIPVTRNELLLRRDVMLLFNRIGISPDQHLLFLDEVPLAKLKQEGRLGLLLFDHNSPSLELEAFADRVVGTIDHHAASQFPLQQQLIRSALRFNIIERVGSACSLVYRQSIGSSSRVCQDWRLAALLSGAIALDTDNLSGSVTTELDREALTALRRLTEGQCEVPSFEELRAARRDASGMTPAQLLARDRKWFKDADVIFGISSILTPLASQLDGPGGLFTPDGAVQGLLTSIIGGYSPSLYFIHCGFDIGKGWQREIALCYLPSAHQLCQRAVRFLEAQEGFSAQDHRYSSNALRVHSFNVPPDLSRKIFSAKVRGLFA